MVDKEKTGNNKLYVTVLNNTQYLKTRNQRHTVS